MTQSPLLSVDGLSVSYPLRRKAFWHPRPADYQAVVDVSFAIAPGETLGLVGESGSGKSTIGRAILRRAPITKGSVTFRGEDLAHLPHRQMRAMRRHIQHVFQDPYASLNPRHRIGDIIAEPLRIHRLLGEADIGERVAELLRVVGLSPDHAARVPANFSGGQRQRIGIARALALSPDLIIADEPTSALDVSIRAQIVNLFEDLQAQFNIAYLFIAHDLAVVRHVSHRIAVLYAGRIVELGPAGQIFADPRHPYTRTLLAAVPVPDPTRRRARGSSPAVEVAGSVGGGCRFAPRCTLATSQCTDKEPPLTPRADGTSTACWHA